jgi:hypothetical protein
MMFEQYQSPLIPQGFVPFNTTDIDNGRYPMEEDNGWWENIFNTVSHCMLPPINPKSQKGRFFFYFNSVFTIVSTIQYTTSRILQNWALIESVINLSCNEFSLLNIYSGLNYSLYPNYNYGWFVLSSLFWTSQLYRLGYLHYNVNAYKIHF